MSGQTRMFGPSVLTRSIATRPSSTTSVRWPRSSKKLATYRKSLRISGRSAAAAKRMYATVAVSRTRCAGEPLVDHLVEAPGADLLVGEAHVGVGEGGSVEEVGLGGALVDGAVDAEEVAEGAVGDAVAAPGEV